MPIYTYECDRQHVSEHFFSIAEKPFALKCPKCRKEALQVITIDSMPIFHSMAAFSADIDDRDVQRTRDPGDGSYIDPTLSRDRKTGKITPIKSRKHREELMRAKGLEPFGETDLSSDTARLKKKRPVHFGAGTQKRRAHG